MLSKLKINISEDSKTALLWTFLNKICIYLSSFLAVKLLTQYKEIPSKIVENWGNSLVLSWDGSFYVAISQHGYQQSNQPAFFPLYPLLLKPFITIFGVFIGSTIFSLITTFIIFLGFYKLSKHFFEEKTAKKILPLVALFPGTVVLAMSYSEQIFLIGTIYSFLFFFKKQYAWSGVISILATASRPTGVVLIITLFIAGLIYFINIKKSLKFFIPAIIAPIGTLSYLIYSKIRFNNFFEWHEAEKHWEAKIDFGKTNITRLTDLLKAILNTDTTIDIGSLFILFSTIFALVFLAILVFKSWKTKNFDLIILTLFTLGVLTLIFISFPLWPRPRFVLTAFPLFLSYGFIVNNEKIYESLKIISTALLIFYATTVFTSALGVVP